MFAYVYMPATMYRCRCARARGRGAWCVVRGAWCWCTGVVRGRGAWACCESACTQACVCHVGMRVRTDRIVAVFCLVLHVGGFDRNTTGLLLRGLVNIVELQLLARAFQVEEHLPDTLQRQCPGIFSTSINSIFTFSKTIQRTYEMKNVPW